MIDYMVMEAVSFKAHAEEREVEKMREQDAWKKDEEGLNNLKNIAGG